MSRLFRNSKTLSQQKKVPHNINHGATVLEKIIIIIIINLIMKVSVELKVLSKKD